MVLNIYYLFQYNFFCTKTAIPIGIIFSIVIVWILSAAMRVISPEWFSSMPIWGISWISIVASILLGLLTVLLAARSPARRAAKVSPLTAVSGNAGQIATFHKAANTKTFKIETALGIHHAKAKKRNSYALGYLCKSYNKYLGNSMECSVYSPYTHNRYCTVDFSFGS